MRRSATRNLVIAIGIGILIFDLVQDVAHVHAVLATTGWTGRLLAETVALCVRNLLFLVGLLLVLGGQRAGWSLLALIAVFMLVRRCVWFVGASAAFDSLQSPAVQAAFSTADLLFRLLCLTVLVDLVRAGWFAHDGPDRRRGDRRKGDRRHRGDDDAPPPAPAAPEPQKVDAHE